MNNQGNNNQFRGRTSDRDDAQDQYDEDQNQQYMVDGQIMSPSQLQLYYQQRGINGSPMRQQLDDGTNMFQNLNQQQVLQMYDQEHEQLQDDQSDNGDGFHDSRIVKTVRSLKRQHSASKTSLHQQPNPSSGLEHANQQFAMNNQQFVPGLPMQKMLSTDQANRNNGMTQFSGLGDRQQFQTGNAFPQVQANMTRQTQQSIFTQKPPMSVQTQQQQPLTAYQRRQLEKQQEQQNGGMGKELSIEERLARLKNVHQKKPRPSSGTRRGTAMQVGRQHSQGPMNPIDFQKEIEARTAAEQESMAQFKAHEEKMKAYQKAKKLGQKPPIGNPGLTSQMSTKKLQPIQVQSVDAKSKVKGVKSVKANGGPGNLRRSSGMNINGSQNSKSTTAHTNEERASREDVFMGDSDNVDDNEQDQTQIARPAFNLATETGERGAKPESNQIRDAEMTAISQKKDKCMEIFRNNTEIREMIVSNQMNPQNYDLNQLIDMLFESRHFLNLLGDLLVKRPATSKLEKFFAQQIKEKLKELSLDQKIENSFNTISQKIQERIAKLRNTTFEIPDFDDADKENQSP